MPKKQPRNAYYFFMIDFREEQKKKGIIYQNLTEVQQAADPSWREAHPGVRAKYENMAKREKEKVRGAPEKKFTSNGISFAEIEAQQKLEQEIQEAEITEIKNFVKQRSIYNMILEEDIYVIDVNSYCNTGTYYYLAEVTILRFSIFNGIDQHFHKDIHPGRMPIGYASDVKLGAQELGLPMPDESQRTDYPQMLSYIIDFLKRQTKHKPIPPMYTMPDKVEQCQDFIRQLCMSAGEDESQLRIYKLENLFFHLVNAIKTSAEEGYPKLTLAAAQLKKDLYKYTPGMGCKIHEEVDKSMECTKSRVTRWAYTVLDKCCPVAGIEPVPGKHIPTDVDTDGVLAYKEHTKEMLGSNAPGSVLSSCNTSMVNEVLDSSSSVWGDKSSVQHRTHKPLRLPKTDYSQAIRPAPELTEANFPSLMGGRGRGRGLARSFDKMSLEK